MCFPDARYLVWENVVCVIERKSPFPRLPQLEAPDDPGGPLIAERGEHCFQARWQGPLRGQVSRPGGGGGLRKIWGDYVRMLFVDYSSAFTTIRPQKLVNKLGDLGIEGAESLAVHSPRASVPQSP